MDLTRLKTSFKRELKLIFMTAACLFLSPSLQALSLTQQLAHASQTFDVYDVLPGTDLSRHIDRIVLEILDTRSGKIFCGAVLERSDHMRSFFLNDEFISKGMEVCHGRFAKSLWGIPHSKSYKILFSAPGLLLADGWTMPSNQTVIYLEPGDYTKERLIRTIAHEMAVAMDRKESMGRNGDLGHGGFATLDNHENCEVIPLVQDPIVKNALTSLRAFDVEYKISSELGVKLPEGFAGWNHLSCTEKLTLILPNVETVLDAFEPQLLSQPILGPRKCSNGEDLHWELTSPLSKIQKLATLQISFQNGSKQNACDFMSSADPYYPGFSFHSGPGPRIGGGGWASIKQNDDLRKSGEEIKIDPTLTRDFKQKSESKSLLRKDMRDFNDQFKSLAPASGS